MTEFDLIIEATRRDFLKQIGATLAAAAQQQLSTHHQSVAAKSIYDITKFINDDNCLAQALSNMWSDQDRDYSDIQLTNTVKKVQGAFAAGNPIKSTELLKQFFLASNDVTAAIYRNFSDLFKSNDVEFDNDYLADWVYKMYDGMNGNTDEDFSLIQMYLPPGDIIYNGEIMYKADQLTKRGIFDSIQDVNKYYDKSISNFEEDSYTYNQDATYNQDEDVDDIPQHHDHVEGAKKSIDNTHSQLGIRRDSAWYESVLKEQDSSTNRY